MCAAQRFRNDFIDEPQFQKAAGGKPQSVRGGRGLFRRLPENGSTSFGTDDRIGGVLQHQNDVGNRNRQSAARAPFPDHGRDDGDVQFAHFENVAADGFGLVAFFSADTGIGPRGIHERQNRNPELFRELHKTQGLAVPFGTTHAEVAAGAFPGVAPLLVSDHHDGVFPEAAESPDDGLIVCELTVAVQFMKVVDARFDVVHRVRAVRVTGHQGRLPRRQLFVNSGGRRRHFALQLHHGSPVGFTGFDFLVFQCFNPSVDVTEFLFKF